MLDERPDGERHALGLVAPEHLAKAPQHLPRSAAVLAEVVQRAERLAERRPLAVQEPFGCLDVRVDGGERLIQLVRQRGGQLPQHADASRVRQVLAKHAALGLGASAALLLAGHRRLVGDPVQGSGDHLRQSLGRLDGVRRPWPGCASDHRQHSSPGPPDLERDDDP